MSAIVGRIPIGYSDNSNSFLTIVLLFVSFLIFSLPIASDNFAAPSLPLLPWPTTPAVRVFLLGVAFQDIARDNAADVTHGVNVLGELIDNLLNASRYFSGNST